MFVSQYKKRVVLVPGLGRTGQAMKMKFSVVPERQTEQGNRDNSMGYYLVSSIQNLTPNLQ